MATTAVTAAQRIVVSKVTGMNSGQLCAGRPPMLSGYDTTAEYHCRK
jgi:hypothetical protein